MTHGESSLATGDLDAIKMDELPSFECWIHNNRVFHQPLERVSTRVVVVVVVVVAQPDCLPMLVRMSQA